MDTFTEHAVFWLPDNPEQKLAGQLSFSHEEGCQFSTIGSLKNDDLLHNQSISVVHGSCNLLGFGNFTLFNCIPRSMSIGSHGPSKCDYMAHQLFAGELYNDKDSIAFNKISVKTDYLDAWVDKYTYQVSLEMLADGADGDFFTLTGKKKDLAEFELPGAKMHLNSNDTLPVGARRKYVIYDNVYMHLTFNEPIAWERINEEYFWPIQNALTFLTNKPNGCTHISANKPSDDEFSETVIMFAGIMKPRSDEKPDESPILLQNEMIMPLSILADKAPSFFFNWIEAWPNIKHFSRMLFSATTPADAQNDTRFMLSVQAMEGLHRYVTSDIDYKQSEAYSLRKKCINAVEQLDVELAKWLTQKISFAHEPSLKDRLLDLFARCSKLFEDLKIDKHTIAKTIVDSHNQYAHGWAQRKGKKALDGLGLVQSRWLLNLVGRQIILEDLGTSKDLAEASICRTIDYQQLKYFSDQNNLLKIGN